MKCPACLLENQPNAIRCHCGYEFVSASDSKMLAHLQSIDRSAHMIKVIVVWWFVLAILAALVAVFQWLMTR